MNYQTCYSCGRESPYGKPLAHFDGCHVAKPASAPPAELPEVRAWIEARREHRRLVAIYNARVQYARDQVFGSVSCDHEYQAMCQQQRVLRDATEAAGNALEALAASAQAREVEPVIGEPWACDVCGKMDCCAGFHDDKPAAVALSDGGWIAYGDHRRIVTELEASLAACRADAELGAWCRATMQAAGPIKTVSGKDVFSIVLPPVERGAGLDAAIDALRPPPA